MYNSNFNSDVDHGQLIIRRIMTNLNHHLFAIQPPLLIKFVSFALVSTESELMLQIDANYP